MSELFPVPTNHQSPDLLIIAGEHSGDEHAARLVKDLLKQKPDLKIAALGGKDLEAAGAQLLFNMMSLSVVGIFEVLKNYSFIMRVFEETLSWIQRYQPKAICFVDYPGFNLRLAKALYKKGLSTKGGGAIKLFYYIGPQVWAWKAKRRFDMAEYLDSLAVIFPFEVDCYKDTDLPVKFVGHPFLHEDHKSNLHYDPSGKILMLPGSRNTPIYRIFPTMLKTLERFLAQHPNEQAVVLYPREEVKQHLEVLLSPFTQLKNKVELLPSTSEVGAKAVIASSGTASLSTALAGIPGLIIYKAHPLTYVLGRMLAKIDYLGIANLLLNKPVYPEFIQHAAKPQVLANELEQALSADRKAQMQKDTEALKAQLASSNASTATDWLLN